jgi:murein DD-endopeptidase MepM/ murein hydrolase activator NlpD
VSRAGGRTVTRAATRRAAAYLAGVLATPATGAVVRAGAKAAGRLGPGRLVLAGLVLPAAVCCLAGLPVLATFAGLGSGQATGPAACPWHLDGAGLAGLAALDRDQWAHGELIVTVGTGLAVPPRAWVVAVATAMQESGLRNLPHLGERNDHDSLGLFQQRPSQGWGTPDQVMDPRYAATAFYRRLMEVDRWQEMSLTAAAQAVQRSAHPHAYARHEPLAVAVVEAVTGGMAATAAFARVPRCAEWSEVTTAGWTRPSPGPVWSGFRTARRPEHYGIDIGAPKGTPVRAAADGTVILVTCDATRDGRPHGCDVDSPLDAAGVPLLSGCGWYVNILHAGDAVTRYCHLLALPEVRVGQRVRAGQPIGLVGSSGNSSGPHLHFEVELYRRRPTPTGALLQRAQTDPIAFLTARGVQIGCSGGPPDCRPVHGDRVRTTAAPAVAAGIGGPARAILALAPSRAATVGARPLRPPAATSCEVRPPPATQGRVRSGARPHPTTRIRSCGRSSHPRRVRPAAPAAPGPGRRGEDP